MLSFVEMHKRLEGLKKLAEVTVAWDGSWESFCLVEGSLVSIERVNGKLLLHVRGEDINSKRQEKKLIKKKIPHYS